jgi:hypothetical protein
MDVRLLSGGLLLQDADRFPDDIESVAKDWELVSGERPTARRRWRTSSSRGRRAAP